MCLLYCICSEEWPEAGHDQWYQRLQTSLALLQLWYPFSSYPRVHHSSFFIRDVGKSCCSSQCWLNYTRTAHSASLEGKGRLLTSLKFLSSRSSSFFVRSGLTIDVFHSLQKQAWLSEVFMMWVIGEMRTGSICFNTCVGMGSNSQIRFASWL